MGSGGVRPEGSSPGVDELGRRVELENVMRARGPAEGEGWMDGSDRGQTPGSRQRAVPAPRRSPHTAQMRVSPQPMGYPIQMAAKCERDVPKWANLGVSAGSHRRAKSGQMATGSTPGAQPRPARPPWPEDRPTSRRGNLITPLLSPRENGPSRGCVEPSF